MDDNRSIVGDGPGYQLMLKYPIERFYPVIPCINWEWSVVVHSNPFSQAYAVFAEQFLPLVCYGTIFVEYELVACILYKQS